MENLHKGHRERLRQSYIENGPDGMHEHQLLELLLTYAIPTPSPTGCWIRAHLDRFGRCSMQSRKSLWPWRA